MSGSFVLVTGGARSGKSRLAEDLAARAGTRVTYVATSEPLDDEMKERIETHRKRRSHDWTTVEEPLAVAEAVLEQGRASDAVIVDCVGIWVSNLLLRQPSGMPYAERCRDVLDRAHSLIDAAKQVPATVILVSNEVGSGVVPDYVLGRVFRDALGWSNQAIADAADHVFLTVAGIPVDVKALGHRPSSAKEAPR